MNATSTQTHDPIFPPLLIPPRKISRLEGAFLWSAAPAWDGDETLAPVMDQARVPRATPARAVKLRVVLSPTLTNHDAYVLTVRPEAITLSGKTPAAIFYALQTLRQLRRPNPFRIPACSIYDHADFPRRGFYLDCSRGKVPTLRTLEQLIDRLAAWKMNELQLYVENVFAFQRHPLIGEGFSPFTADEFLHLQAYASARHIRLVGSLASLGHMETILALPPYRHLAELPGFYGYPGGTTLCPTDPASITLMQELYEEFVPLFTAGDFNLCGDEPWELGQGRSRDAALQKGTGTLYADFILSLSHLLTADHGKRVNMWGDVVANHPETLSLFPRDTVMLNWEYGAAGKRFPFGRTIREHGFPLVVCPGTNAWQTHSGRLGEAMANVAGFAAAGRQQEAEGLLMTDWGDCGHRNLLGPSLLPAAYAAAHAWNGAAVNDSDFLLQACDEVLGFANPAETAHTLQTRDALLPAHWQALYHGLVTPVTPGTTYFSGLAPHSPLRMIHEHVLPILDTVNPDELRHLREADPAEPYGSAIPGPHAGFEELARCELALGARLDQLSARRILLIRNQRAGETVSPAAARRLTEDLEIAAEDFSRLWLARNRPSRLQDNLTVLHAANADILKHTQR